MARQVSFVNTYRAPVGRVEFAKRKRPHTAVSLSGSVKAVGSGISLTASDRYPLTTFS